MPNISVKDVPDVWTEALRRRAVRNHRSLQGELMAIIERAVAEPVQPEPAPPQLATGGIHSGFSGGVSGRFGSRLQVGDFISSAYPQMGRVVGFDRTGEAIVQRGWKSAAQISSEMRAQFPVDPLATVTKGPSSVDIVREDRDSR